MLEKNHICEFVVAGELVFCTECGEMSKITGAKPVVFEHAQKFVKISDSFRGVLK